MRFPLMEKLYAGLLTEGGTSNIFSSVNIDFAGVLGKHTGCGTRYQLRVRNAVGNSISRNRLSNGNFKRSPRAVAAFKQNLGCRVDRQDESERALQSPTAAGPNRGKSLGNAGMPYIDRRP